MRKLLTVLAVLAMLTALGSPAIAAKPNKPPKTPDVSYYTLGIASDELSTTCTDAIVRRNDVHFEWFYDEADENLPDDIELNLALPGLAWGDDPVTGCLNAGVIETHLLGGDVETGPANGYFRITLEDDGTVAMLWIFEIYERYDEVEVLSKNKKRTTVERVLTEPRTDFRMGGPYEVDEYGEPIAEFAHGTWSEVDGVITGDVEGAFTFVHYESGGDFTLLTNAVHNFEIAFTLAPVG